MNEADASVHHSCHVLALCHPLMEEANVSNKIVEVGPYDPQMNMAWSH